MSDGSSTIDGATIVSTPEPSATTAGDPRREGGVDNGGDLNIDLDALMGENFSASSTLPSLGMVEVGNIPSVLVSSSINSLNTAHLDFLKSPQVEHDMSASQVELARGFDMLISISSDSRGCGQIMHLLDQLRKKASEKNTRLEKMILIQRSVRRWIAMKAFEKQKAAALVQSQFRKYKALMKYNKQKKHLVMIQAAARRFLAAGRALKKRSSKEHFETSVLNGEQGFKEAVESINDARDCNKLQDKLVHLLEEVTAKAAALSISAEERIASEEAARQAKAERLEQERLAVEVAARQAERNMLENERIEQEREARRAEATQLEQERLEAEQANAERLEQERELAVEEVARINEERRVVKTEAKRAESEQPEQNETKRFRDVLGWGDYVGELNANGLRHGKGKMTWDCGRVYEGQWANDKREGTGTMWYDNSNMYEGEWKAGKWHGCSTYHWKDGHMEVGQYKDGKDHGKGVRWSTDRQTAWLLKDGIKLRKIGLNVAKELAVRLGFHGVPSAIEE